MAKAKKTTNVTKRAKKSSKSETATYKSLRIRCEKLGISVSELCRVAEVERSFLERLRRKEPKTIELLKRIEQTLGKLENQQSIKAITSAA